MLQSKSYIFSSVLYNLALADFSDKDVVSQLISSNETLNESNKAMTEQLITQATTIASLLQYGTVTMGQTIQDKSEVRRKKYEEKLGPRGYSWSHGHMVIHIQTRKTFTNKK